MSSCIIHCFKRCYVVGPLSTITWFMDFRTMFPVKQFQKWLFGNDLRLVIGQPVISTSFLVSTGRLLVSKPFTEWWQFNHILFLLHFLFYHKISSWIFVFLPGRFAYIFSILLNFQRTNLDSLILLCNMYNSVIIINTSFPWLPSGLVLCIVIQCKVESWVHCILPSPPPLIINT